MKLTTDPSAADMLAAVNTVAVCTALALVPLAAVLPPTVGLKMSTDRAYATELAVRPNTDPPKVDRLTVVLACNQLLAAAEFPAVP